MSVSDYNDLIEEAAKSWNVDPHLLRAVMQQESGGNPRAVSPKGARGLMQIMPGTAQDLGVTDPHDPAQAVFGGAKYLSQMLDRYGDPVKALAAYNAGPGTVDAVAAGKGSLPAETQAYIPAVTAHYVRFKGDKAASATGPAVQSDEDFLKSINGTGAKTDGIQSDDEFLKSIGATAPKPEPAPARNMDVVGTGASELPPIPVNVQPKPQGPSVGDIIPRAAAAAASPWQEGSAVQGWLDQAPTAYPSIFSDNKLLGPTNRVILHGLALPAQALEMAGKGVQSLARGAGALAGGVAAASGDTASGRLERDIAQAPDAILAGVGMAAPGMVGRNRLVPAAPEIAARETAPSVPALQPSFARLPAAVETQKIDLLRAYGTGEISRDQYMAALAELDKPPPPPGPVGAPTIPQPESVGAAATPGELSGISAKEAKAYAATAEGNKLIETQPVAHQDATEYVPGSRPTAAEISQSADQARAEKLLETVKNPEPFKLLREQNNNARTQFFDDIAGNPTTALRMREDLDAEFAARRAAVFANKKPVDAAPVLAEAESILKSPGAMQDAVESAVKNVANKLKSGDALHDDPEMLYGLRKHINNLIAGKGTSDAAQYREAQGELIQLRNTLDRVIEEGAPGFQAYIKDYSDAVKPIEATEFLQQKRNDLFKTPLTFNKMQNFMKQVVDGRMLRGPHPAQGLTDEQMGSLWALRDDLRRQYAAEGLARARGSDTVPLAYDLAKSIGGPAIEHAIVGKLTGGIGNIPYQMIKSTVKEGMSRNRLNKDTNNALNPQVPLRNRLLD